MTDSDSDSESVGGVVARQPPPGRAAAARRGGPRDLRPPVGPPAARLPRARRRVACGLLQAASGSRSVLGLVTRRRGSPGSSATAAGCRPGSNFPGHSAGFLAHRHWQLRPRRPCQSVVTVTARATGRGEPASECRGGGSTVTVPLTLSGPPAMAGRRRVTVTVTLRQVTFDPAQPQAERLRVGPDSDSEAPGSD